MPRPPLYPPVPPTALEGCRWRWRGRLLIVERAGQVHLEALDREWSRIAKPLGDESSHWRFALLGSTRPERFIVRDEAGHYLGAWLDHSRLIRAPPALKGQVPDAYRLDFLSIRSDLRGQGLGRQLLGLVATRASEQGGSRIVFQSLEQSRGFFEHHGAKPSRWRGPQALTNLEFDDLRRLMEVLDVEVR